MSPRDLTMSENKIEIPSLASINDAARAFLNIIGEQRVFAFYGAMGAGKTTFIKALCQQLGVKETVASPTFAIVNEYQGTDAPIYHFDFYRIKTMEEAYDFGYEDYFFSGNFCFIEWPERIEPLLPPDAVDVHITVNSDDSRTITFN